MTYITGYRVHRVFTVEYTTACT